MNPVVVEIMRRCKCGHGCYTHTLNPKKVRTWCASADEKGNCPCRKFEAASDG